MRAVRLLLGDGELCIQAFVRGEIHCFVDGGSVYEGCYVRVDKFWLGSVEVGVEGEGGGGVRGDLGRLKPEGGREGETSVGRAKERVVYLVVGDMVAVGWNEEYLGILRREREGVEGETGVGHGAGGGVEGDDYDDRDGKEEEEELIQLLLKNEESRPTVEGEPAKAHHHHTNTPPSKQPPKEKTTDEPDDHISDSGSDSAFEILAVSAERAEQRRTSAGASDPRRQLQAAITKPRPWLPTDATQPLKLTPLSSIPHLPYRQNWMVNVLAVVTSLSAVEPSYIGPSFKQRTARLADMSLATAKQVHLTVYLDPEEFTPQVGGVVLLLGVKNHLFEGGSLRKYVSDGLRGGASWWIEAPEELGWCRAEVSRLRAWWGYMYGEGGESGCGVADN